MRRANGLRWIVIGVVTIATLGLPGIPASATTTTARSQLTSAGRSQPKPRSRAKPTPKRGQNGRGRRTRSTGPVRGVVTALHQLASSPQSTRSIALTFDDGPSIYTGRVLDILDRYHVKATFFLIGQQVAAHPDIVRDIVSRGHNIANHSWSHPRLSGLDRGQVRAQIDRTDNAIVAATSLRPTCVRPPYGAVSQAVVDQIGGSFHQTVNWTVDPLDWKNPGTTNIIKRVLGQARPGAIVLNHDGGGNRSQTIAALPAIIEGLQARGYTFATICAPLSTLPPMTVPTTAPPVPAVPTTTAPTTTAPTTTAPTTTAPITTTTAPTTTAPTTTAPTTTTTIATTTTTAA